jgi:hypothetical protein
VHVLQGPAQGFARHHHADHGHQHGVRGAVKAHLAGRQLQAQLRQLLRDNPDLNREAAKAMLWCDEKDITTRDSDLDELLASAGTRISRYQMNAVKKLYGVENASYETLSNTPAMLSRITKDAYTGMQAKSESDPDAFEDTAYLDALNTAIEELRADGTLKTLSEKYFGQDISSEN